MDFWMIQIYKKKEESFSVFGTLIINILEFYLYVANSQNPDMDLRPD